MSTVLEIDQLRKQVPKFKLNIAVMRVEQGEFAVLLSGPKAGKGTLFKLLLDMLFPDFGTITLFGLDSHRDSEAIKQQLGLVARRPGLYYGASLKRLKHMVRPFYREWDEQAYRDYLRLFELDESWVYGRVDNAAKKQFVLALALAHRPQLLLLDEPFLHVPPQARERMAQSLWQERRERGMSLLLATTEPEEAARLADSLHILHGGSLLMSVPIEQLPEYASDLDWQGREKRSRDEALARRIAQTEALFAHCIDAQAGEDAR